jgi:hypothetical protein
MTTETQEKDTTDQHDAFREQRKAALFWLRKGVEDLDIVDRLEGLLPSFVRRRYRITGLYRNERLRAPSGTLDLCPVDVAKDDVAAADTLHADVSKLHNFLFGKCPPEGPYPKAAPPTRTVNKWDGLVRYEFFLPSLPGFEGGLTVTISRLPAGSTCHITKKVTGTRVVEDVEYEMVCDDDTIPTEEAAEAAAKKS